MDLPVNSLDTLATEASSSDRPSRFYAWRRPLVWLAILTAIGTLHACHFYLNEIANRLPGRFWQRLAEELTGTFSAGLLVLPVVVAARRIRDSSPWPRRYAWYFASLLVFSALHTSLIWGSRSLIFPLIGLGSYDYGSMPWRYAMEFGSDVVVYILIVSISWLLDHYRASRARELRAAQLETALADARLEALRLQLNPHFLFNALNAVSASMYEQPRVADEMLARIGELLRATLQTSAQQHALGDELRLLELYLDIQRARFGDRLDVRMHVAPGLAASNVPFLLLQPLVENAVEHGGSAERRIDIHIVGREEYIEFLVRDNGDGTPRHRGHGIGLGNVRARLNHLYGEATGVELAPAEGGGMQVRVWLPLSMGGAL
ncbi:histidine kinase [Luteibacter rhizovicinus]|uniref:Histidine kinase n=1 Tax=Luteibacter rhizovicinus TaxID=242606 RepID=A0A4R3YQQ6_9GAMM|nr:histidine kinase [Luteibacter rhizovicinus]TCV93273.1 histidine kinase [Luteibacter rhizovicinus]